MENTKQRVDEMLSELKKQRDELEVRLHLAKMDVSDEWDRIGVKLDKLEAKAKELGDATAEVSKDIGAAAKLLGEEIGHGLREIARHF